LTLNTVSLLLPEQRWCSLRNLNPPLHFVTVRAIEFTNILTRIA
jgi:hypothetical protein